MYLVTGFVGYYMDVNVCMCIWIWMEIGYVVGNVKNKNLFLIKLMVII